MGQLHLAWKSTRYKGGDAGRWSGWGRYARRAEAARLGMVGRGGAPAGALALALEILSAGEGTESQRSPHAGGRPAKAALNQGGHPTGPSPTEGQGGRPEKETPFLVP